MGLWSLLKGPRREHGLYRSVEDRGHDLRPGGRRARAKVPCSLMGDFMIAKQYIGDAETQWIRARSSVRIERQPPIQLETAVEDCNSSARGREFKSLRAR